MEAAPPPLPPAAARASLSVLFFSRGRGRGHAFPDMAIAEQLKVQWPEVEVQFVSYATGAETFRRAGVAVIDLELPEANPFLKTLELATRLIAERRPDLVVSHEETSALVAASICRVPSIFISSWIPLPGTVGEEALGFAGAVVLLGAPGIFPAPASLARRPRYVGPVLRRMACSLDDRPRLRERMRISPDTFLVVVVPGGWSTEARAPLAQTVFAAFKELHVPARRLIWLSAHDRGLLETLRGDSAEIEICEYHPVIEELLVCSDVVVTKGTYGVTAECASLGVTSLSLSHGLNRIDDMLVPRIRSNLSLVAAATSPADLRDYLQDMAERPSRWKFAPTREHEVGAARAAAGLVEEMSRLLQQSCPRNRD